MRIVFWGSSDFAVASLERLLAGKRDVVAVVTQPDRQKGRHLSVQPTPVKDMALRHKRTVLQPQRLEDAAFMRLLEGLKPDLFVVVAYGKILTKEVLAIPSKYSINIHASLLPQYRGAAPISWAIVSGEATTGISIIKMNEKMDEGDIIIQQSCPIAALDTAATLSQRLAGLGAQALIEILDCIEKDDVSFIPQNSAKVSYAPLLTKEDGHIDWSQDAARVYNHIRGMNPWPGSFTLYNGKLIKIWDAEVYDLAVKNSSPGAICEVSKTSFCVMTANKALRIKMLQMEGGKRLDAEQFIAGHSLKEGQKLD